MAIPTLLTAGEAFEDLVFVGLERIPAPGEEIKTNTFHATIGGGAVITAVGAARLGISTAIVSALSDAAVKRLRREKVRVHNLKRAGEHHAISAALSTGAERSFVTYNGVNAVLEPRLLEALAGTHVTHLHLALCPSDLTAWTRLVTRLRKRGVTVSWDFGWSESLAEREELPALMDALDFVFVNDLEAPLYARVNALDDAYPPLRTRTSAVIVKLGPLGSRWLRADGDVVMPAPRVDAVDTTGAGDAFNAGFLAAWLRGGQPALCLATGNAVGAASTRAAGGLDALPAIAKLPALLRPMPRRAAKRAALRPAARSRARRTTPARRKMATAHTATPVRAKAAVVRESKAAAVREKKAASARGGKAGSGGGGKAESARDSKAASVRVGKAGSARAGRAARSPARDRSRPPRRTR